MQPVRRRSWFWIHATLAAYLLGFALFVPRVILIVDEDRYISQAVAFASGSTTIRGATIMPGPDAGGMISNYPPGTSLLQTPFVWLFGWRGAALASVLALIVTTLVTARWLELHGRAPAFALLVPGFLSAALYGRVGMSDVPATALVAAACFLVWRATPERRTVSALAGACIGATLLFREPVLLLLAPLALGAVMRRTVAIGPFLAAGAGAVVARMILAQVLFGSALFVRDSGVGFSPGSLLHTVPVFGAVLLVMIPGGALLPALYRGERRVELVAGVVLYVGLFLLYDYNAIAHNGVVKGFLLESRFMIPLVPVLAWMAADVAPRYPWTRRVPHVALGAAVVILAFLIHPVVRAQEAVPHAIVQAIEAHTRASAPVITNSNATLKYLSPVYRPRTLILRYEFGVESTQAIMRRSGELSVVLLDRTDSEMFRRESHDNQAFVRQLRERCDLRRTADSQFGGWARLHTYEVHGCR